MAHALPKVMAMESERPNRRGGRAHHSVLEPHFEAIRQWRRQRKTWKEIAVLLASEKGVRVTLYAPYRFIRRRLMRPAHWEDQQVQESEGPQLTRPKPPAIRPSSAPVLPASNFHRPDRNSFNPEEYL
jgi:hypothetical protein